MKHFLNILIFLLQTTGLVLVWVGVEMIWERTPARRSALSKCITCCRERNAPIPKVSCMA